MEEHRSHKGALIFLILVSAVAAFFFWQGNQNIEEKLLEEEARAKKVEMTLAALGLEAKAVSVYDITESRKIYGKDDELPMPLASLAKTMTVALAVNNFQAGEVISISEEAIREAGDYGLLLHEKWKVEDLAKLTLISSANDGARALSEGDPEFVKKMNEKAQKIGMEQSFFLNATGLDVKNTGSSLPAEASAQAGAFASAFDANLLASYGMRTRPEIFKVTTESEITLTSLSDFEHTFKNTDIIIEKIPNLLFSKTGFTEVAGGNLTVVFVNKDGHLVAITVLGSSFEGRFTDMEKIVDALYNF